MLSKIKKGVKGIFKGVKKAFKSVLGGIGKVMQNKWVRGILLVVSLVVPVLGMATAGWSAAAGQGIAAQMAGALSNVASGVASMVVNTVTAPIKLLAEGGAKAASFLNAEGLATTFSNAAQTVGGAANSIFGTVKTDSFSQIMGKMGFNSGGAAGAAESATAAAGGIDNVGQAVVPTEAAAAADTVGGMESAAKVISPGAATQTAATAGAGAAASTAAQAAAPAAKSGLLDKTLDFINKNPTAAKIGFSAIQAATAQDPIEQQVKYLEKQRADNDRAWASFNAGADGTSQAVGQYADAYKAKYAPFDFSARETAAREYLNSPFKTPLLTRPLTRPAV
ncbi:MAG TPA: hypothetical protein VN030_11535 [Cellvibrio sp.]|nr:hypothetical protein [Cellvibrio sp.]